MRRNSFNAFQLFCISPYTAAASGMFSVRFQLFGGAAGFLPQVPASPPPPTRARLGAENGLLSRNRGVTGCRGRAGRGRRCLAAAGEGRGRMRSDAAGPGGAGTSWTVGRLGMLLGVSYPRGRFGCGESRWVRFDFFFLVWSRRRENNRLWLSDAWVYSGYPSPFAVTERRVSCTAPSARTGQKC